MTAPPERFVAKPGNVFVSRGYGYELENTCLLILKSLLNAEGTLHSMQLVKQDRERAHAVIQAFRDWRTERHPLKSEKIVFDALSLFAPPGTEFRKAGKMSYGFYSKQK